MTTLTQTHSKVQELAIQISNVESCILRLERKNKLLSYLSQNIEIFSDPTHPKYLLCGLFEIYLNNLSLLHQDSTALLLSTHFRLLPNEKLSNSNLRVIVFDVSPIMNEEKRWDVDYIKSIANILTQLKTNNFTYRLRICDGFHDNGEIQWFDPYLDDAQMSVQWAMGEYTVRDFETTCKMCSMGKRSFENYVVANF